MGWRDCVHRFSDSLRTLPFLHKATDEKVQFAKFSHSESERELHVLQNGSVQTSMPREDTSGCSSDGDEWDRFRYVDELSEHGHYGNPRERISEWQAGWNVTNAIQGMFIVSFPYAVHQGGYWSLLAMVLVAYICCHTGQILVHCLYELNPMGRLVRVRASYVDIAEHVWGRRYGARLVNLAQIIELLMTCILYVLLCGDLIEGSFPDTPLDLTSWIMVSTVPLLACAFLTSLRKVSWLSFWCTVAHMLINLIILIYCFTQAGHWHWREVKLRIDIWTLPIALGIIVFSYTSQIFLPTLEGNLIDRGRFACMMHWTHIAAAVFKAVFSYIGFLTWGMGTKEVITNNLPHPSFKIVVNLILVAKALLSYPLPFFAAAELLQTALFQGRYCTWFPSCLDDTGRLKVWGLALRLLLVLFTTVLAIIIPHFTLLMGLIGSFTGTMLSFVWPCYFHLKIKWYSLGWPDRILDIGIIFLGFLFGSVGMYYSAHALSRAYRGLPPEPIHG
ncbi:vesicular inhibitory amino acid transporter-like [Babylonia areolata]|uniref:vesicular inhibitory amino acid transporter-like n=1 Tax=Babylonia areolata TaxID=304850 RepID=UPI003FCF9391